MSEISRWKTLFQDWPTQIPTRGQITTVLSETIPFKGFMYSDDMLLLDRTNPDALGGRFILLEYSSIAAVKFIDPLKTTDFMELGLRGKLAV